MTNQNSDMPPQKVSVMNTDEVEINDPANRKIDTEVKDLRAENDRLLRALAYLAECHAATAEQEGGLKRTSERSRKRFASICYKAAEMLGGADLPETTWGREGSAHLAMERCLRAAEGALGSVGDT